MSIIEGTITLSRSLKFQTMKFLFFQTQVYIQRRSFRPDFVHYFIRPPFSVAKFTKRWDDDIGLAVVIKIKLCLYPYIHTRFITYFTITNINSRHEL